MGWFGMVVLCAVAFGVAALVFLAAVTGLSWSQLKDRLLQYAYNSFTFDGIVIPGMRPHRTARFVIRLLSPADDERRNLLAEASASKRRRNPARDPRVPVDDPKFFMLPPN